MKVSKSRAIRTRGSASSSVVMHGLAAIGLASVAVLMVYGSAQAKNPPCFSQPAVTMEPTLETAEGSYEITDGKVSIQGDDTTEVVLRAPVFNTTGKRDAPWTHFSVLFTDPDGLGEIDPDGKRESGKDPARTNKARVQAVLKFIDQSGSPPQKVEKVELDSNKARADTEEGAKKTRHARVKIPKGKLNFESNYYFVEITLTRKAGSENTHFPDVLGFKLCKQFK